MQSPDFFKTNQLFSLFNPKKSPAPFTPKQNK
jgi:hypothetical protein